jgi:hypothetical protein
MRAEGSSGAGGAPASRRSFLCGAIGVLLAPAWLAQPRADADDHVLLPVLARLLPHAAAARCVGERYLRQLPAPHRAEALRWARVWLRANGASGWTPSSDLRLALDQQRRHDFASGAVVLLDGWFLARCDAALCALAARSVSSG